MCRSRLLALAPNWQPVNAYYRSTIKTVYFSPPFLAPGMSTVLAAASPPAYNTAQAAATQLPPYPALGLSEPITARPTPRLPKEFSFELKNFFGQPFANLSLLGHPALSGSTPTFLEGTNINGTFKLNLRTSDPIKSIVVFVRGDLVVSGDPDERTNFFRMRKFLWRPSMGDPRAPVVSGGAWTERLKGEYEFPFSIKFPELVPDPNEGGERKFRLPHSFAERSSRSSMDYYLELRIDRGKFRSDDRIITSFGFFSMQAPSLPSQLRLLASQSGVDAPGPYSDPDGWHALEPVRIQGILFGEQIVNSKCTLCYTRATSIPCAMTIEVDEESESQFVDLLASIKFSVIYLQRTVRCSLGHTTVSIVPCGQATWRSSTDSNAVSMMSSTRRQLTGEIYLRRDLQPTTAVKEFQVEYAVAVFPPAAVGFKSQPITGPLTTQSVEVVTRYASGVRQATAPAVEPEKDQLVDRYYESVRDGALKPK
ncbi:hypothetical protein R3P38DRAFT_2865652 [Favolaschia claudopus]|uniref:Arrestin-like N-terminal domain-containing protein n=1 Tax=Favolaschia claudopus TaxID=2862362 RepID=A0AAW0DIN5_9AGAR